MKQLPVNRKLLTINFRIVCQFFGFATGENELFWRVNSSNDY